uniref:Indoleacetamide hydrolase (IAH) ) n=1 Tax=Ganoderma boninense TaxID=34458 RepID=A0A5K1JSS8_9APHY|nr:Indoleacetamide hydrolase (IAH) (EC (Indole-3-acetamide hydrolase) [Ganoderma boninense]
MTESEDERTRSAADLPLDLPARMRERQDALATDRTTLQECRTRVLHLIQEINEVFVPVQPPQIVGLMALTDSVGYQAHAALEEKLIDALAVIPPQLHATRSAQADVIAATIEAALLKLSVVRARAHRALYGHALPGDPRATVARAVTAAHAKLKERQRAQDAEMQKLDRQIDEYESMLSLVDGRDGSFAQVVKDMARVKQETEECRKDLRRLGWTED